MPPQRNFAVLLCRFNGDLVDPAKFRVMDLAAFWRASTDATFIAANLTPDWDVDGRTLLQIYEDFFTLTGTFTMNLVDYYDRMSHGLWEMFNNQIFPIQLDISTSDDATYAANHTGKERQDYLFQLAKMVLKSQYNVNWKDFYGVVVSFQSAVGGGQGGTFDGGPGAFVDIRYVKNNGTSDWGHEIGHALGLDHSRTDGQYTSSCTGGDPSDYTDPWDVMSGPGCASKGIEPTYGTFGPGINAWNMRAMGGLDESRIWKFPPNVSFSQTITLNPLHRRENPGFLGAELPGIGSHSNYLVEFRVPTLWDQAIGNPVVIVHRFDAPHSYIMKGTRNQKALGVGDAFVAGSGPYTKLVVNAIDSTAQTATVQLCHGLILSEPSVTIEYFHSVLSCDPATPIENQVAMFTAKLSGGACNPGYQVLWSVHGGVMLPGQSNTAASIKVVMPPAAKLVILNAQLTLNDGTVLTGKYQFHPLSAALAKMFRTLCLMKKEQDLPHPWWEWNPGEIVKAAGDTSVDDWKQLAEAAEAIAHAARKAQAVKK